MSNLERPDPWPRSEAVRPIPFEPLVIPTQQFRYLRDLSPPGLTFETGSRVMAERGTVVGILSLGNSYYTKNAGRNLEQLLRFSTSNFSEARFLIPEQLARYTYSAVYGNEQAARRVAKSKARNLLNKFNKLAELVDIKNCDLSLVKWSQEVKENEAFEEEMMLMNRLFRECKEFNLDVRKTSAAVLNIDPSLDPEGSRLTVATQFLLGELAFLCAFPKIVEKERVAYVYHKRWPIYENLIAGAYDGQRRASLGMIIVGDWEDLRNASLPIFG